MRIIAALGLVAALALASCVSIEKVKTDALQKAEDHCASEGKQFVHAKIEQTETDSGTMVVVSGNCVGPGDPGYIKPGTEKH